MVIRIHSRGLGGILVIVFSALWLAGCGAAAKSDPPATGPVTTPAPTVTPVVATPPPGIKYVAIVVLENKDFDQVIGSSDMPYLNSVVNQYALATNYYANGTESLPNYFMLTVGDTITTNAGYDGVYTGDNVVRELVNGGKSWKTYAESIPSVGYLGPDQPPYMTIHNPFAYLSDVVNSSTQQNNIVPFTQLAADLSAGKLPNYLFIIPNNSSNMHDCPPNMSTCSLSDVLKYGDNWLKTNIDPLLTSKQFQDSGILIITFDESYSSTTNGGGRVPTIIAGAKVKHAFQSDTFYQHQSTLRLMLKALAVNTYPGAAASAPDMDQFFTGPLP